MYLNKTYVWGGEMFKSKYQRFVNNLDYYERVNLAMALLRARNSRLSDDEIYTKAITGNCDTEKLADSLETLSRTSYYFH